VNATKGAENRLLPKEYVVDGQFSVEKVATPADGRPFAADAENVKASILVNHVCTPCTQRMPHTLHGLHVKSTRTLK
jgi:hypothetical protein